MSNEENHKKFVETLESLHDEDNFRVRSYGGRNMYREECVGVTCESEIQVVAEVISALVNDLSDDDEQRAEEIVFINWVLNFFQNWTRTDSMGRDHIIVYWPRIPASLLASEKDDTSVSDTPSIAAFDVHSTVTPKEEMVLAIGPMMHRTTRPGDLYTVELIDHSTKTMSVRDDEGQVFVVNMDEFDLPENEGEEDDDE